MNTKRKLGVTVAAAAVLVTASAFAEERPSNETWRGRARVERRESGAQPRAQVEVRGERPQNNADVRSDTRATINRERMEARTEARQYDRGDSSRSRGSYDGNRGSTERNRGSYDGNRGATDRNRGSYEGNRSSRDGNRGSYDRNRGDNRGSYDRNRGSRSYGYNNGRYNTRPQYYSGRVSRYERYGSGYRVWIGGVGYPFYVPLAYWNAGRFRIGVDVRLGGWYNPLGYYDYCFDDDAYYRDGYGYDGYRDGRIYRTQEFNGVVRDYDYRRRTALVQDDYSGDLVTVYFHSRDARINHLRRGDYIQVEGGWRGSVFEVYRVFDVD